MSDRVEFGEDLTIPFIFVADGEPEPPELAAFKARYPDWFSIPATYVPYSTERQRDNGASPPLPVDERRHRRDEDAAFPPPRIDRRPGVGEPGSSLRAFQRANAAHAGEYFSDLSPVHFERADKLGLPLLQKEEEAMTIVWDAGEGKQSDAG